MELKGEQIIKAPRDVVFAALNDPDVLKESIPGCQVLTKLSDTQMEAEVGLKIGPVKATFKGAVQLSNIKAPKAIPSKGKARAVLLDTPRAALMWFCAKRTGTRFLNMT